VGGPLCRLKTPKFKANDGRKRVLEKGLAISPTSYGAWGYAASPLSKVQGGALSAHAF